MSELTKAQTTNGFVDFSLRVPEQDAEKVRVALEALLALLGREEQGAAAPGIAEVFGSKEPGRLIRGARFREGWTQAELARRLSASRSVVCDLERGRRPVSLAMAKRLAQVFSTSYKVFLP